MKIHTLTLPKFLSPSSPFHLSIHPNSPPSSLPFSSKSPNTHQTLQMDSTRPLTNENTKNKPSLPLKFRLIYFLLNTFFRFAITSRNGKLSFNRKFLTSPSVPPNPIPDPTGVSTADHIVDASTGLFFRLFSPSVTASSSPLPVIVYFHGGGFIASSAVDGFFDSFCRRIAGKIPAHVASVEYRLAPEHRYPAQYEDGVSVLKYLDKNEIILNISSVFVAGDSAGGNIAHHVAVAAAACGNKLRGVVSIQPFFGGEEDTESEKRIPFVSRKYVRMAWRAFLPEGASLDHVAARVFGGPARSEEEWRGHPETMVVIGDMDPFQDRQRMYCDGLRTVGVKVCQVEYRNAVHAFFMFEKARTEKMIEEIGEFVRRKCEEEDE